MKRFYFLILLMSLLVNQNSFSQVSKQEAIDFVTDSIVGKNIDSVNIYMESNPIFDTYYQLGVSDSIYSPYNQYWLFFVDTAPYILAWDHSCYYVLIDTISGNSSIIPHNMPPFDYRLRLDSVSIVYQLSIPTADITQTRTITTLENGHLYAVLFAVDANWHALSHLYSALRELGFPHENIYVLFNDGDPSNPYMINPDLDGDGSDDIMNELCTRDNLHDIFIQLEDIMHDDDLLFMYSISHGEKYAENGTRLKLWNYDLLYDSDLASMVHLIPYSHLIYFVTACHAGGMIDDFDNPHESVISVVNCNNYYWGNVTVSENTGMFPFDYGIITAIRGFHPLDKDHPYIPDKPIGEKEDINSIIPYIDFDINPDTQMSGNDDEVFQVHEIINYGKYIDLEFQQGGDFNYSSGFVEDLLSPTGISGEIFNNQTITGNYLIGGDLTLTNNTSLTIADESKLFLVNGDFTTEDGSNLILGDDMEIRNFQEAASFNVNGDFSAGTGIKFESNPETTLDIHLDNNMLQPTFNNTTFERCNIYSYAQNLKITNNSSLNDCGMAYSFRGEADISGTHFNNSGLYFENTEKNSNAVSVANCVFTTDQNLQALSIYDNCNVALCGNPGAETYDEVNYITDNDSYEVYASTGKQPLTILKISLITPKVPKTVFLPLLTWGTPIC